jgi:cytochrome P450
MDQPSDPISAATHADPYPYYAELVTSRPIHRDDTLGLWVAAGAGAVTAVLKSDITRVRPAAEPVPRALLGSAAGEIFGQLVRMNDGAMHMRMKPGVSAKLTSLDPAQVAGQARTWAQRLADELEPAAHAERLADFAFRLPVYVIASLLGVASANLAQTASWVGDFVRCLAPTSTPEQIEQGKAAAERLAQQFRSLLGREQVDASVANTIGYLSQAYEATAGLIGNTLVVLGRETDARAQAGADAAFLGAVVREVVRYDPPVQNTRRFLAGTGVVAGQTMAEGDTVLVVLAAANRDPTVNAHPERFDPLRRERQAFTFGLGAHACPGEALATAIAEAGVQRLLAVGVQPEALVERARYRPSANTRVPVFEWGAPTWPPTPPIARSAPAEP